MPRCLKNENSCQKKHYVLKQRDIPDSYKENKNNLERSKGSSKHGDFTRDWGFSKDDTNSDKSRHSQCLRQPLEKPQPRVSSHFFEKPTTSSKFAREHSAREKGALRQDPLKQKTLEQTVQNSQTEQLSNRTQRTKHREVEQRLKETPHALAQTRCPPHVGAGGPPSRRCKSRYGPLKLSASQMESKVLSGRGSLDAPGSRATSTLMSAAASRKPLTT